MTIVVVFLFAKSIKLTGQNISAIFDSGPFAPLRETGKDNALAS